MLVCSKTASRSAVLSMPPTMVALASWALPHSAPNLLLDILLTLCKTPWIFFSYIQSFLFRSMQNSAYTVCSTSCSLHSSNPFKTMWVTIFVPDLSTSAPFLAQVGKKREGDISCSWHPLYLVRYSYLHIHSHQQPNFKAFWNNFSLYHVGVSNESNLHYTHNVCVLSWLYVLCLFLSPVSAFPICFLVFSSSLLQ